MPLTYLLQSVEKFEIETYKKPRSVRELRKTHVPFSGSPQKHPLRPEKIVLVLDPYSGNSVYYEFYAEDISYVEELPHIVDIDGEVVNMARIWVKKMSVGVRSTPFIVEDISR